MPHISSCAVAKILKNNNVNCEECVSAMSIGIHISDEEKETVLCDISYLNARDKVGLTWPNESAVVLSDLVLSVFENTLSSECNMKSLMQSASLSRVELRTLRRIVEEKVSKCDAMRILCSSCQVCGSNRMSCVCTYLTNTLFNIGANNFTMLLNRKENAKKISLKVVKLMKQKNSHQGGDLDNTSQTDPNKWTGNEYKSFLRLHNGLLSGNVKTLQDRCVLLKKLIGCDLQHLISMSTAELRKLCNDLKLIAGNKDEMTKSIFSVLANECDSGDNQVVMFDNCIELDSNLN